MNKIIYKNPCEILQTKFIYTFTALITFPQLNVSRASRRRPTYPPPPNTMLFRVNVALWVWRERISDVR